jgi:hypothetical protein
MSSSIDPSRINIIRFYILSIFYILLLHCGDQVIRLVFLPFGMRIPLIAWVSEYVRIGRPPRMENSMHPYSLNITKLAM